MAENKQIAVTDANVVNVITAWSEQNLRPFYRGKDFDAWKGDVALAIVQNEKLRNLLQAGNDVGKLLLMRAIQMNASSGLSLNPQHGEAAITVYEGRKGLIVNHLVMKNGLVKKALETRKVIKIESGTIFDKDEFKIKKSSRGDEYEWTPALRDRGKAVAYFACIILSDNTRVVEYWTREQTWEHALKYGQGRIWDDDKKTYKNEFHYDAAWNKSFDGQAEKTAIRSALKNLYLPELEDTFAEEDRQNEEADMRNVTPPPQKGTSADSLADDLANRETEQTADAETGELFDDKKPAAEDPIF